MNRSVGILCVLLATACATAPQAPNAPLDRARFERVLAGALLVESRIGREITLEGRKDSTAAGYYDDLYRQEGITEADFKATYEAYLERPELLKDVYQEVLIQLQHHADSIGHAAATE
ncbi:MAG: DUF4296 domain-containing protein [Flavobacteriales bacterium]|nr:DUF4296 domain-containing protein [Flavobacteriales bacterium]MBP9080992.1 DUF4296 domain-containing protein [Flavobacteriales bacterium]